HLCTVGELEPFEQACDPLPSRRGRDAVEVAEVVEVLGRSVAPIEPRLVRYDAEASADGVQAIGYAQAVELDQARVGAEDAAEAAQRGRLAGAVLAEQDQDLAALHCRSTPATARTSAKLLCRPSTRIT